MRLKSVNIIEIQMDVVNCVDEFDPDAANYADMVENIPRPRRRYQRSNYFDYYDDSSFVKRFRLTKATVLNICERIEDRLEYFSNRNNSIKPIDQLLLTLRVYATGGHLLAVADYIHTDKATVSRLVKKVSTALAELAPEFIKMPRNDLEIKQLQNDFYNIGRFPKVIGAIDCTHIKIQSVGGQDAEIFRNRKGWFSINVQAITNANLQFQDIVARWPGSSHDATIFNQSTVNFRFQRGDFPSGLLLGDSGYMCKHYLLTPFQEPTTAAEQRYNNIHIRTRIKVEQLFGVWKRRFPILAYGCRLRLSTTLVLIVATATLHNIALLNGEPESPLDEEAINNHELQMLIQEGNIPRAAFPQRNLIGFLHRRNLLDTYFARL